jgi:hypothetical protein
MNAPMAIMAAGRTAGPERMFAANQAWLTQRTAIELGNALMGGTSAMRAKGERYLPRKASEDQKDYAARLTGAHLDNFFQKTVIFYLGQVFKRELRYEDPEDANASKKASAGGGPSVGKVELGWFEAFKEDVDLAGTSLTIFGKDVFQSGLVDGVSFVVVDYTPIKTRQDAATGRLEYLDAAEGAWKPKSPAVDQALNLRPYLIHVKASQVLDAWTSSEGGKLILKHFRYEESVEVATDPEGLTREAATQVIAWWPHKWEKWRRLSSGSCVMVDSGPNTLGRVPVAWFRPGEPTGGLTARPPLDDLAEMNRSYWAAMADHDGRLMPYVRSPAFFSVCVEPPKGGGAVPMSPGLMISVDNPGARLESVGVDSASAVNSQTDLNDKREAMRDYGLQTVQAGVTATMSENVATNASSSLKGWCAVFKDCMENALRLAAAYQGMADGPALVVNTEFKSALDLNLLGHLYQAVAGRVLRPEYYASVLLSMMPFSDEWDVKSAVNPEFGKEDGYLLPELGSRGRDEGRQLAADDESPVGERSR